MRHSSAGGVVTGQLIRVLIADDHAAVRGGFRLLIDSDPQLSVVGEAADGGQAVELARRTRPDVVLMDIQMDGADGVDGIEATRLITADPDLSATRILILTTFDIDEYVIDALGAGASGFLLKNVEPERLLHGIRVIAGGEELLSPGLTGRLLSRLGTRPDAPRVNADALAQLTDRERHITALAALGMSNHEIAADLHISHATVKTHVNRAMTKLAARDRAHLVAIAYRSGLISPPS
jgi:DNA-binding NarL/FixJ family response regulator